MRIEFIAGVAGARFSYEPGEKVDLRDDLALSFVRQGVAKPDLDGVELAIAPAPENAAKRVGVRRRTIRNLAGLLPG